MADQVPLITSPLPRAPLMEAVFELRWKLKGAPHPSFMDTGELRDPGFRILLGKFYDRIRSQLPVNVDLQMVQVPEEFAPYVARHQFRATDGGWPVAQLGPGLLTYNDTKNYNWITFKARIDDVVKILFETYPRELHPLELAEVKLVYLNGIGIKPERRLIEALADALHVEIKVDAPEGFVDMGAATNVNLAFELPLDTPKGVVGVTFSNRTDANSKRGIVWNIIVACTGADVPQDVESLCNWVEKAHTVAKGWFGTLARGKLLSRFMEKKENEE